MNAWIEAAHSGAIYVWIGGLLIVEVGILAWHHRQTGRGIAPRALVTNALAGLALLAVAWFACHQRFEASLIVLALAGLAHAADLVVRWPKSP